jgi:hypothetical protein
MEASIAYTQFTPPPGWQIQKNFSYNPKTGGYSYNNYQPLEDPNFQYYKSSMLKLIEVYKSPNSELLTLKLEFEVNTIRVINKNSPVSIFVQYYLDEIQDEFFKYFSLLPE